MDETLRTNEPAEEHLADALAAINDRLQRDPTLTDDELLAGYAPLAEQLREMLPAVRAVLPSDGEEVVVAPEELGDWSTKRLGDFRLLREIGRGGMGVVYEAYQESLERRVALKVLNMAGLIDPQHQARFRQEFKAAATLHHPHIVPVFAVGQEGGVPYCAMQIIDGPSLAEVLGRLREEGKPNRDDPPSVATGSTLVDLQAELSTVRETDRTAWFRRVLQWGVDAADALACAHENGVLHRDVKPGNLLLDQAGKVWLVDFGLARLESGQEMTVTGDVIGTLRYMSPEQALGKKVLVDQRADVYSLGMTLYELLGLTPPFEGEDRESLLHSIAFDEPRPLRHLDTAIPIDVETVILKATTKEPHDRYLTAADLRDDLRRCLEHRPVEATRPSLLDRAGKLVRRHRVTAAVAALSLLVLAIVSGGSAVVVGNALADARAANGLVTSQRDQAIESDYVSAMHAACSEWNAENLDGALTLLDRFRPPSGAANLRGWEWRCLARLCRLEEAHIKTNASTTALQLSPEGTRLAALMFDKTLRVWDTSDGRELVSVKTGDVHGSNLAWSPESKRVAGIDVTGRFRIWDTTDGQVLRDVSTGKPGNDCVWNPAGGPVALGHTDGSISLWDGQSDEPIKVLREDKPPVWNLAWSPSGEELVVQTQGSKGQVVEIWDVVSGQRLRENPIPKTLEKNLIWASGSSEDDQSSTLALFSERRIALWNPTDFEQLASASAGRSTILQIASASNGRLASLTSSGVLQIRGHDNLGVKRVIRAHRAIPAHVTGGVAETGGMLIASSAQPTPETENAVIKIWGPSSHNTIRLPARDWVAWSRRGAKAAFADPGSDGEPVYCLAEFRPDTPTTPSITRLQDVRVCEPNDRVLAAWSPDDDRVLLCESRKKGAFAMVDTTTGKVVQRFESQEIRNPGQVAWNPNGEQLAVMLYPGVVIYDLDQQQVTHRLDPDLQLDSLAWSNDGRWLAGSTDKTTVRVWEVGESTQPIDFVRQSLWTGAGDQQVAWADDNRVLVGAALNGWVFVWDVESRKEHCRFHAHPSYILAVATNPRGDRIATLGGDSRMRLWTMDGRQLLSFDTQEDATHLSWSGDGEYLSVSDEAGDTRVWYAPPLSAIDAK